MRGRVVRGWAAFHDEEDLMAERLQIAPLTQLPDHFRGQVVPAAVCLPHGLAQNFESVFKDCRAFRPAGFV
jgi:hypothetical protein